MGSVTSGLKLAVLCPARCWTCPPGNLPCNRSRHKRLLASVLRTDNCNSCSVIALLITAPFCQCYAAGYGARLTSPPLINPCYCRRTTWLLHLSPDRQARGHSPGLGHCLLWAAPFDIIPSTSRFLVQPVVLCLPLIFMTSLVLESSRISLPAIPPPRRPSTCLTYHARRLRRPLVARPVRLPHSVDQHVTLLRTHLTA